MLGPVYSGCQAWPVWEQEEGNEEWSGVLVIHSCVANHPKTKRLKTTVPLAADSAVGRTGPGSAGQVFMLAGGRPLSLPLCLVLREPGFLPGALRVLTPPHTVSSHSVGQSKAQGHPRSERGRRTAGPVAAGGRAALGRSVAPSCSLPWGLVT